MVRFHIPNMRCGGCVRAVTAALRDADAEVRVDLERREVAVQGSADASALAWALRAAGFEGQRFHAWCSEWRPGRARHDRGARPRER